MEDVSPSSHLWMRRPSLPVLAADEGESSSMTLETHPAHLSQSPALLMKAQELLNM